MTKKCIWKKKEEKNRTRVRAPPCVCYILYMQRQRLPLPLLPLLLLLLLPLLLLSFSPVCNSFFLFLFLLLSAHHTHSQRKMLKYKIGSEDGKRKNKWREWRNNRRRTSFTYTDKKLWTIERESVCVYVRCAPDTEFIKFLAPARTV